MISKEQIEELAIFAGFRPITHKERYPAISTNHPEVVVGWETPDKNFIVVLPDFPHDLNACEKYILPKFQYTRLTYRIFLSESGYSCEVLIITDKNEKQSLGVANTLSEALCLAVLKLIKEEKE